MARTTRVVGVLILTAWSAWALPTNDTCEAPTDVPEALATRYLDTVALATATSGVGEPALACVAGQPAHTVWYRWTAPADGGLDVRVGCPSAFPVIVAVWADGLCSELTASLSCIAGDCSADFVVGTAVPVTEGETYLVELATPPATTPTGPLTAQLCLSGPDADDADDDGLPDCFDDCTDEDLDGFGDGPIEARPFENCPPDNCDDLYNPDQADKDQDGLGDACDPDEEKEEKTLQQAAQMGLVQLGGKGCFDGDCVAITIRNPGSRGLIVSVRPGDVLLNRSATQQHVGVSRRQRIYVPPGGTATLGGLFTVCLELDRGSPSPGATFDVTDNLGDVPPERLSLQALDLLLALGPDPGLQAATWAITDAQPAGDRAAALLRRAGLDPAALPPGGFPPLVNPYDGSDDPFSRFAEGVLVDAPPDCALLDGRRAIARCLAARLATLLDALPGDAARPKLRRQIGKRLRAVRARLDAADRAPAGSRKSARALAAAERRADALVRLLGRAIVRETLALPAGARLVATATELAVALGA